MKAGLQTANVAYFQRKIQLSEFSAYSNGSPFQLITINEVLVYVRLFGGTLQFSVTVKPRVNTISTKTRCWPLLNKLCVPPHPQKVCLWHYLNYSDYVGMECIYSVSDTVFVADNASSLRKSGNKGYIDRAYVTMRRRSMLH